MTSGFFLPTGSWIVIVVAVGAICFLLGSLLWLSIPNRIRQALDNFSMRMGIRIESIEGQIGQQRNSLRTLIEEHLVKADKDSIASHNALMAEFALYALSESIIGNHRASGECYWCGCKHPKAQELEPGDPALYSPAAHGKLKDGKTCPIPFLYKLASDRAKIQARISHNNG